MDTMDAMDTSDEIPLEDHRYFYARLEHLESRNPATLLTLLESERLTEHLRVVTGWAIQAKANLVVTQNMPEDQADELVMSRVVADPEEQSRLDNPASRIKLRTHLERYKAALPGLPRTYRSQSEIIE
jgi:hypothetical protein